MMMVLDLFRQSIIFGFTLFFLYVKLVYWIISPFLPGFVTRRIDYISQQFFPSKEPTSEFGGYTISHYQFEIEKEISAKERDRQLLIRKERQKEPKFSNLEDRIEWVYKRIAKLKRRKNYLLRELALEKQKASLFQKRYIEFLEKEKGLTHETAETEFQKAIEPSLSQKQGMEHMREEKEMGEERELERRRTRGRKVEKPVMIYEPKKIHEMRRTKKDLGVQVGGETGGLVLPTEEQIKTKGELEEKQGEQMKEVPEKVIQTEQIQEQQPLQQQSLQQQHLVGEAGTQEEPKNAEIILESKPNVLTKNIENIPLTSQQQVDTSSGPPS